MSKTWGALRRRLESCGDLRTRFAEAESPRFYWLSADRQTELAAFGEIAAVETRGPRRLATAARRVAELLGRVAVTGDSAPPAAGPLVVGGFGFWDSAERDRLWAGYPALRFWLPAELRTRVGGTAYQLALESVARPLAPQPTPRLTSSSSSSATGFRADAEPAQSEYAGAVSRAVEAIGTGELEKVVLARACTLTQPGGFDVLRALSGLAAAQPGCAVYAVGLGDACFVGASPERLMRRVGDELEADALAGSAPRGRTPEQDAQRARALRESKKEQAEHAVVRRAVLAALEPECLELRAAEAPGLLRLEGIQHLHTSVWGRLARRPAPSALELTSRLYPTPAVAGEPRREALRFLRRHEGARRGWYSGGVGWQAACGDGELAVALRSALLRGDCATLHAGAGIVTGSTPEAELAETRLKLAAALGALVEI